MKNEKSKMKNEKQEKRPDETGGEAMDNAGAAAEVQDAEDGGEEKAAPEPGESEIKQAAIDALTDRLQRTMAEFDNFRKRTAKEMAAKYGDGVRDTIEKLLPVVDNLELALVSIEDKESPVYKGVEMIFRQTNRILCDMGLEPLPGEGEPFDHNCHNAVEVAGEDGEGNGEPVVAEVLRKGYRYRDKVVRPSMVKVRK